MRIGFISGSSPDDRRASSGTNYKVAQALGKIGELCWIPVKTPQYYRCMELAAKALAKLCGKNLSFGYTYLGSSMLSGGVRTEKIPSCDVLVAFWQGSTLGNIDTMGKPVVYLSDATFPAMVGYYPAFSRLFKWNVRQGTEIERHSLDKASAIVLSSDWSAASAVNDLHQPRGKVHVVEFGANIDEKDIVRPAFSCNGRLDVLFMGVEWERKGGDVAVEAVRRLNEDGVPSTLHIVGIRELPPQVARLPYINYIGFLNKNVPEQYQRLVEAIRQCRLLLLPTKAECAGVAFCEASAYGMPVFTYDTGGIPNYVLNGVNGYRLPTEATGSDFARKIKSCFATGELEKMSSLSNQLYKVRLNWNTWAEKMRAIVINLLDCR